MKSPTTSIAEVDPSAWGGRGAPYDYVTKRCVVCGSKVEVEVTTDGNGHLVETPAPCRSCGLGVRSAFVVRKPKIQPAPRPTAQSSRSEVRAALLRGTPLRVIAQETGVSLAGVSVVRKLLDSEGRKITCRCGRPAFHIGRCRGQANPH